nr:MAG TPA: cytochrome c-type biogenesis protein [Caudoviricetes sp.]DAW25574.1 MAG TPA: cytochrome c-type biogenesis protein [Caudoviricetes sp.]
MPLSNLPKGLSTEHLARVTTKLYGPFVLYT